MSTLLESDSPWLWERLYFDNYPESLEPKDLYQPRVMSNADNVMMYESPHLLWEWKTFSRQQLPSSVEDEYELMDPPNYLPYTVDISRIVPSSEQDSEETPPAPEPPSRKTTLSSKGNNPFGSRGCESCAPCRRRKGRVCPLIRDWLIIVRIHFERSCMYILSKDGSPMWSEAQQDRVSAYAKR